MSTKETAYKVNGQVFGFRDEHGKLFLVRCPSCKRENYALNVSSGVCTWCGWNEKDNPYDGDDNNLSIEGRDKK